jgi:hypothetical protein
VAGVFVMARKLSVTAYDVLTALIAVTALSL